jgi:hypothetical protein
VADGEPAADVDRRRRPTLLVPAARGEVREQLQREQVRASVREL